MQQCGLLKRKLLSLPGSRCGSHLLKDFLEFDINDALFGDDFESGGQLALHYKDLGYLMDMAHESGAYIPICSFVHEIFKTTKQYGDPDWFQPGIILTGDALTN